MPRAVARVLVAVFLSSAIAAYSFPVHSAEPEFLSEDDVVEISIRALSGDRQAARRLKKEARIYEKQAKTKEGLSAIERARLEEIKETLLALSGSLRPARTPEKEKRPAGKQKAELELPYERWKYFGYADGALLVYAGEKRDVFTGEWRPDGRRRRTRVLKVEADGNSRKTRLLTEILDKEGEWLVRQIFEEYKVTDQEVRYKKKVVFNEPSPGKYGLVGKTDSFFIMNFPLKLKSTTDRFRVAGSTEAFDCPAGLFSGCLVLENVFEKWIYAPGVGQVLGQNLDERWILKELSLPRSDGAEGLGSDGIRRKDKREIYHRAREFCQEKRYRLLEVAALRMAADEKEATTRLLVYRQDPRNKKKRRYDILDLGWIKKSYGDFEAWTLKEQR